ncbi:MAG: hypothetical protein AB7F79_09705 [Steroidobacteraceae bacterium]
MSVRESLSAAYRLTGNVGASTPEVVQAMRVLPDNNALAGVRYCTAAAGQSHCALWVTRIFAVANAGGSVTGHDALSCQTLSH